LLSQWGLTSRRRFRFRELSLGARRRLAIVISTLRDPTYFLMDEPFNGLDPQALVEIRSWIKQAGPRGKGVIVSSHNLAELQGMCTRVVVLHLGKVKGVLPIASPDSDRSQRLVVSLREVRPGVVNLLDRFGEVHVDGRTIVISGSSIDPGEVNSVLVREGYVVVSLTSRAPLLEEDFLEMVREVS
jgi:ABC-2 type transport system ATP-binding protein